MTNDVPNIPLAGHMLDKETLLPVARWLLLDIYWDDDREGEYRDTCRLRGDAWEQNLVDRPGWPAVPDELDALMRLMHICGRIEQSWGRSFFDVARTLHHDRNNTAGMTFAEGCNQRDLEKSQFVDKLQTLVYRTIMACIGHGIGPADDGGFPDELLTSPIQIENPMQNQLDLLD